MRLLAVILLLAVAACGTTEPMTEGGSVMIDVPAPPFPYNSRFCT
ncbi:MAG TPA: hypothetical protein VJN20_02915 [Burkholderiales bacterium]|nr:hypothetical protein [Burkholderiales bacterium]